MHRPTLFVGLIVILAMCLVPPFESGPIDRVTERLQGEEDTRVEYQPVWSHPTFASEGPISFIRHTEIAGTRLLLQIVVVVLLTGAIAAWRGPRRR